MSFGAIAFTGPDGARLGVLPLDVPHLAIAALAGLLVLAIGLGSGRGTAVAIAVAPLVLVLLPWLPFRVPAAFLVWTGALASLVWVAVAIALSSVAMAAPIVRAPATATRTAILAGVLSFAVFAIAAWSASPAIPGGDEPHYLVITQSLLLDGDLKIGNNHQRGDYRAYFGGDLPPHVIRLGRHGDMYSIHAPGLPAIILPAFAIGGYHGVVVFLILLSAAACSLAWWLAWRTTGSTGAAWFGWAAVTFSAPFLLESYTVFPDAPGAAIVLTGFWALLRADWDRISLEGREDGEVLRAASTPSIPSSWVPWLWHGAALALLPWLHTRFAVLAATLAGLILVRLARAPNPFAKATALLAVPAVGAMAWLGYFVVVYGTLDPTAPYGGDVGSSFAYFWNGSGGLLFDQGFGILATAPVVAVAVIGFWWSRRLGVEWLVVAVPYFLSVGTYAMWWAGSSGPARFLVPLLPPLAIPAAAAWSAARSRGLKALMLSALVASAWLSAVMAGGGDGRLGYHGRNAGGVTAAPYLEWATHVVDLPAALPAFVPQPVQPDPGGLVSRRMAARSGFAVTLAWALCLGGAAFLVVRVSRRSRSAASLVSSTALTLGCAVMLATSMVWTMRASERVTVPAAQMEALRRLASGHSAVFDLTSRRLLTGRNAWVMEIDLPVRRDGRGGARGPGRPLAALPMVPAGSYLLTTARHGGGDGLLMVGVGNDQFAIVTQPLAALDGGLRIDLPAGARTLTIRGDEIARDQVDAIQVRPLELESTGDSRDLARRAVRYGAIVAFFVDDRALAEPSGFWVEGGREARLVLAPDGRRGPLSLLLRNAPVESTVTLEFGGRREALALAPGEERRIEVPLDPARGVAVITIRTSAGFRPSELDPNSRDTRMLGVYVRVLP